MALLASDVMARAAVLLNDASQATFNNVQLLPKLKIAWDDLQTEMIENGAADLEKKTTTQTIAANATSVTSLPTDFIYPIELWERTVGASEDSWVPMKEREFLPNRKAESTLQDWAWMGNVISLIGALNSNDIRIYYYSTSELTGESSPIPIPGCTNFLAYRTAAIQAAILKNNDIAGELQAEAAASLGKFLNTRAKQSQSLPVRRKPYHYNVMLRRKRRF